MEFVPVVALVLLVRQLVTFLKAITNGDTNAVVTQLTAAVGAVGALLVAAQTQWASGIAVGDTTLSALNIWGIVFVGITLGAAAGAVNDVTRAINRSDSSPLVSSKPLLPPR